MWTSRDTFAEDTPSADGVFSRASTSSWRFTTRLKRGVMAQTSSGWKREFYGALEGTGDEAAGAVAMALVCSPAPSGWHRASVAVSGRRRRASASFEYRSTSLECSHAYLPNRHSGE